MIWSDPVSECSGPAIPSRVRATPTERRVHHTPVSQVSTTPHRPMHGIDSKTVLVTGAGGGFGSAITHRLAEADATVAVNDVDPDRAEATVEAVDESDLPGEAFPAVGDVTDLDEMRGPSTTSPTARAWSPRQQRRLGSHRVVPRAGSRSLGSHRRRQLPGDAQRHAGRRRSPRGARRGRGRRLGRLRRRPRGFLRRGRLRRDEGGDNRVHEDGGARTRPRRHQAQRGLSRSGGHAAHPRDARGLRTRREDTRRDGRPDTARADDRARDVAVRSPTSPATTPGSSPGRSSPCRVG